MKKDIHPKYFPKSKVTCACGNAFTVGSTQEKIQVEICSACHPFFTGEEKVIDTAGRVEKFKTRRSTAQVLGEKVAVTKKAKAERTKEREKKKAKAESKPKRAKETKSKKKK